MSKTKISVSLTNQLISDKVTFAKPVQALTEVENTLLSGEYFIQAIGMPRKSFEVEFITTADQMDVINNYAAIKTPLKLERHGQTHIGIIAGSPDWNQEIGSTDPSKAVQRCRILLRVTGGS